MRGCGLRGCGMGGGKKSQIFKKSPTFQNSSKLKNKKGVWLMGWVEQIFGRMCAAMSPKEENISKPVAASSTFVIFF